MHGYQKYMMHEEDKYLAKKKLHAQFAGENGPDISGLTKDLLTSG
jgi:hypothetical protein